MLNMLKWLKRRFTGPSGDRKDIYRAFRERYSWFKELLISNSELLGIITDIEQKLLGHEIFGMAYIRSRAARAVFHSYRMVQCLNALSGNRDGSLMEICKGLHEKIKEETGHKKEIPIEELILPFSKVTREMVDWVGGKCANLGEVFNRVHLPIPEGFAITTKAFESVLSINDLREEINKRKMEVVPPDPETLSRVSEEIQRLVLATPLPVDLEERILSAYDQLAGKDSQGSPALRVAMRSSAIGEDSDLSYAGQYVSSLNVPREKLTRTYRFILASLYTPRAMAYRLSKGILDEEIAMSVACLPMVDAVASGVMYSRHPFDLSVNEIVISAVWGLGPYAVDGVITPDTYRVAKGEGHEILESKVSLKPVQLVCNPEGGLMEIPVREDRQSGPCLTPDQIRTLARYAIELEKHFGGPQDIEWALNGEGILMVLQTRPLGVQDLRGAGGGPVQPPLEGYPLLVESGAVACPGVGIGPAFHVRSDEDLARFPEGAVLVAEHSSPKFMVVMQKARAIVTNAGSVTGHMASLVREFRVPCILDAKVATRTLLQDMEVTVDAYAGRVYQGSVPELLAMETLRKPQMKNTPVYETLRRVADWVVPLHLIDPRSPEFTPKACRSLHDIARYVHERSYAEMFQISDMVSYAGAVEGVVKLAAPIPLDLYIIDLDGGLTGVRAQAKKAGLENIASLPFKALLRGMMHEGVRWRGPRPVQLKGLLSVMTEQMLSPPANAGERFGDRSYAIVSDKYLNFSSRVGYHYSILDTYCGNTVNKNYITFSFKGGAADDLRRQRRARAIAIMLSSLGFAVDVQGDRVTGRLQKYERAVIEEKLDRVGRLLQFTRQMDMLMESEASVEALADAFLQENYSLEKPVGNRAGS